MQKVTKLIDHSRLTVQITLSLIAARSLKKCRLLLCLDPLGDNAQIQRMA